MPYENEIIFDFFSRYETSLFVAEPLHPQELSLIEVLEKGLAIEKIAFFSQAGLPSARVVYNAGFGTQEVIFLKDSLSTLMVHPQESGIRVLEHFACENTYITCFVCKSEQYCCLFKVRKRLAPEKYVLGDAIFRSLAISMENRQTVVGTVTQQFYQLILDNIVSGIIVIDDHEVIVFLNRAAEIILGYRLNEVKNQHCSILFNRPPDEKNWLTMTSSTGALSSRKKVFVKRKDGFEVAIGGSTSLLKGQDGTIIGVIGIFREFSDFEKTENSQKDLNKMSLLAKFSSSIAHEIRNPLAGISATAQVLASKLDIDDRKRKYVSVILEEIDRINRIIKELLSFASPSRTAFLTSNINKILESCLNLLYKKIQKNRITVVCEYDRELPDILCDENQLKQAFANIMMNSVDAMPDGGVLTISTDMVIERDTSFVKIAFIDTGAGIPDAVLQDLFTPFSSTKTNGLGLGLTITRNILKQHQALIKADNLPGGGAQFEVMVPQNVGDRTDEQIYLPLEDTKR
ncbi:PAS domain S-box protein [bacterium]|nr:PAS domain S-box protein [bacterium]